MAYVRAVASVAGYSCTTPTLDDHSIDLILNNYTRYSKRRRLELQVKSTARANINNGFIHYDLPIKNYHDLRIKDTVPKILVCVILISDDPVSWIEQTDEQLSLMKCAYYISLEGSIGSNNTDTIRIKIPLSNLFTPEIINNLIDNDEQQYEECI